MTININTNIGATSLDSATAILGSNKAQSSKTAAPDKKVDQLPQDSATINSVGDLVAAALKQPEVRADRVSSAKESIAAGTYKVDPDAIASSLLENQ
jgi:flagellar biosynthesis anti-sigma factor FlgM